MSVEPSAGLLADLRSALDKLTRPPLVVAVGALMLVLLYGILGRHLGNIVPPSAGNLNLGTGDFMAFWTGAVAIHEGHGGELYNYAAQQALQGRLLGGTAPGFQPYLNPPLLAVLLSPLVPLGFVKAFYVYDAFCALMLAAGLGALLLAAPRLRSSRDAVLATVLLVASYQPMVETTLGGQNTAITFALLAGLALAVQRRSELLAGVFLGLLTFKPQYAIGAGLALLMAGWWRAIAAGSALGLAHYALGAILCGPRWPSDMLAFLSAYRPLEIAENIETHFSWVRTADFLLPSPADSIAGALGAALIVATWWRFRGLVATAGASWFALVLCGTMLASPHQQYYDVALLALPACLLVDDELSRHGEIPLGVRIGMAVAYIGYPAWNWANTLGVQPLFLVLAAVSAFALRACRRAETA